MANKYRLSSNAYERETADEQISPKKIYFISVEGVATEVEYIKGLSAYRSELGINECGAKSQFLTDKSESLMVLYKH